MDEREELAHLRAPSTDPKQRRVDYWGRRAEKAEDEVARLRAALAQIKDNTLVMSHAHALACRALEQKAEKAS